MKRNLLAVIVLLVAAALSFGLCRWARCAKAAPSLDALQDVSWLSRKLDLNPQQVQDIRKLQQELRARLETCDSASCAVRCQLGGVLFSGTNGEARASALVDSMCKAQADSERATLEHMRSVHKLLNPAQQKRYEELVSQCVCSVCSHQPPHGL